MANDIAYITKTMPKVVDKVLRVTSRTESILGNPDIKLNFLDAHTIQVTKLASTGLEPYNRGGHGNTNSEGAVQSSHEKFTIKQERYSAIPLDKLDTLDDAETVLGHQAKEFLETKVVPELDAYRFSTLAGYTSVTLGNRVVVSSANLANNVIKEFNKALKWLADSKVPEEDIVIYVSPEVMELIRNSNELYKKLSQSEYAGNVSFAIQKYENKEIIEVPSDEFYTDITMGKGYSPSATSKKIHFLFVYKKAPIPVKRLDWSKVYDSDTTDLGYVGYKFCNLLNYDIFVSDNLVPGIYACISETDASTEANVLRVDVKADATSNYSIINRAITQPAGILWDKIRVETDANAPSIGASVGSGTVVATISDGVTTFTHFDAHSNSHTRLVAEYGGKVVAVSKDFTNTLPKGA